MYNKKITRITSLFLALVMLLSNMVYANVSSGGEGTGGAYTSGTTLFSNKVYGTKISILKYDNYGLYRGDTNGGTPKLMEQLPTSARAGESTPPGEFLGAYPIYFVGVYPGMGMSPEDAVEAYYGTTSGTITEKKTLGDKVVNGGIFPSVEYANQNEINAASKFKDAFVIDWAGRVDAKSGIEDTLDIKRMTENDPTSLTEEQKQRNRDVFNAIVRTMSVAYGNPAELESILNNTSGQTSYVILFENMVSVMPKDQGSRNLITARNFEAMCLQDKLPEKDSYTARQEVQNSGNGGSWSNIVTVLLGKIDATGLKLNKNTSSGTAVFGKLWYEGPETPLQTAKSETNKWGFGTLPLNEYFPGEGEQNTQLHIMDINLADKSADATRLLARNDGYSQVMQAVVNIINQGSLMSPGVQHSKTPYDAYYGSKLSSELKAPDYKIEEKQMAFTVTETQKEQIQKEASEGIFGRAMIAPSFYSEPAITQVLGAKSPTAIAFPKDKNLNGDTSTDSVKSKYLTSVPIVEGPEEKDNIPVLQENMAVVGMNPDIADLYSRKDLKTVFTMGLDLKFAEKNEQDKMGNSVILNGSQYLWWVEVGKKFNDAVKASNIGELVVDGQKLITAVPHSNWLYGMRADDSSFTFNTKYANPDAFKSTMDNLISNSSSIANNEVETNQYKVSDSNILNNGLKFERADENKDILSALQVISITGENVEQSNNRGIVTYAKQGVGSFGGLSKEGQNDFTSKDGAVIDYRGYYGNLPHYIAVFDKYTPVDLIVLKNDKVSEVYANAWFAETYNGIKLPTPEELGFEIKHVAVKPSKVDVNEFLKEFIKQSDENGNKITVNGVSVPLSTGDKEIVFSVNQEDLNLPDRVAVVIELDDPFIEVVKVYDSKDSSGKITHDDTTYDMILPPPEEYSIEDEGSYELVEWFTTPDETKEDIKPETPWDNVKDLDPKEESGTDPKELQIKKVPKTIYIHYIRESNNPSGSANIILTEKRISKKYTLSKIRAIIPLKARVGSIFGNIEEILPSGKPIYDKHKDWVKSVYTVVFENYNPISHVAKADNYLKSNSSNFGIVYRDNKESGNAVKKNYTTEPVNTDFDFVAFREDQLPTLAKYSYNIDNRVGLGNHSSVLGELGVTSANKPKSIKERSSYSRNLMFDLNTDGPDGGPDKRDTYVRAICTYNNHQEDHYLSGGAIYDIGLKIEKHVDLGNKGQDKPSVLNKSSIVVNGKNLVHVVEGVASASDSEDLTFYPYVEMVYDTLKDQADDTDMRVNVLSDNLSVFKPSDYIEYGWFNADMTNSLILTSTQWTMNARATNGATAWQQRNRVLPGGGIFSTKHNQASKTSAGVITWQTYVEDATANALSGDFPIFSKYTYALKEAHNNELVKSWKDQLEVTNLQMWANKNYGASPYAGQKVGSGISFNGKQLQANTKYWYQRDPNGLSVKDTEGDLDVLAGSEKVTKTYYRMRADVDGKVYAEKSSSPNGGWSAMQTWQKLNNLAAMNGEVKELDDRTKLVTNFFKSLDRNTGSDGTIVGKVSENDSTGPAWYNEAFRGICVVKIETSFDLGLERPLERKSVLDPYLEPAHGKVADLFTNAHVLGIKVEDKEIKLDFSTLTNKSNTKMKDVQDLLVSRFFWVPNASVTDVQN